MIVANDHFFTADLIPSDIYYFTARLDSANFHLVTSWISEWMFPFATSSNEAAKYYSATGCA
jgi:hypothetical protein